LSKVIAVADSDSYVKWAAAMLAALPAAWPTRLVIVATVKQPSEGQLASALAGSGIAPADVVVLDFAEAVAWVAGEAPDAVLVATIGPLADVVTEAIVDASVVRPVILSGLPGIGLPARRKALLYRSQVDLLVLHSKREIARFTSLADENGLEQRFGLTTLPFVARPFSPRVDRGGAIVFAAQAIVPLAPRDRVLVLSWLVQLAERRPDVEVVIKVRAVAGERQTHDESDSYVDLLERCFSGAPANLVVRGGAMRDQLAGASALVTISSTAALEAIALGLPVLALDEFGVSAELINEVFAGSGLFGSADDLVNSRFGWADPGWMDRNYFHAASDDTWIADLVALVKLRRSGALPHRPRVVRGAGGTLRRAWDRRQALGRSDRSGIGALALVVGTPARWAVLAGRRLVRRPLRTGDVRSAAGHGGPVRWGDAPAPQRGVDTAPGHPAGDRLHQR
jgi:hypothetical protein